MTIHHYCPVCDTPLETTELPDEPFVEEFSGYDVCLDCPACGWEASAIDQRTMCEAWDHALGEFRKSTVLISEVPDA